MLQNKPMRPENNAVLLLFLLRLLGLHGTRPRLAAQ